MSTEIKARPILFNTEMVKAILDDRKTMTRRIANTGLYAIDPTIHGLETALREQKNLLTKCPLGQVGERLWVRETWRIAPNSTGWSMDEKEPCIGWIDYNAGGEKEVTAPNFDAVQRCFPKSKVDWDFLPYNWRPSIFMPRWASRITLEITDIRIEQLNEITEDDARLEGIIDGGCLNCGESEPCGCANPNPDARDAFACLWQSIYGSISWCSNPWVWVISFKRVMP